MDPTTDPAEDEMTLDGVQINADETAAEYTVSIKDYHKVLDSVKISNIVNAKKSISNDGKIIVEGGKTLSMDIEAKDHWSIESVKSGETVLKPSDKTYSLKIEADTEVTIETVATYTYALDNEKAPGVTLQRLVTDDAGKTTRADLLAEMEKDGNALKLVTNYTAKNDTLTVSYMADGEDDGTIIPGVEEEDPTSTAATKEKITVYTIPADVLASLNTLKIVLVKNEQKNVTFEANGANDKVEVKVWGEKPAEGNTAAEMDYVAIPEGGYKVIAGEKAKFKATAKSPYKITAVNATVGGKDLGKVSDATSDGVYELTVTDTTVYSFDTEIDSKHSKPLTFNLAADKKSAAAKVTGVTKKPTESAGSDTVLSGDDLKTFLAELGIGDEGDGVLTDGAKAVKIPDTVKDITVTVTAGDGYKLSKINNEAVKANESTTATLKIDFENIGEVKVETAAEESSKDTYFKIDPNTYNAETQTGVQHIVLEVGTGTGTDATVTVAKDDDGETVISNTYKVKEGTDTVSITMTADEGWVLEDSFFKALEGKAFVAAVTPEPKDKKTVYTVKLLASKLGEDAKTGVADLGAIAEKMLTFTAAVDKEASSKDGYSEGAYVVTPVEAFPLVDADEDNIPYNATLKTTISAQKGYTLKSVTATMGGTALPAIEILENTATIEIQNVTGNVVIKVETAPAYNVTLAAVQGTNTVEPTQPVYGDETWSVKYNGKYIVNVDPADIDIKDLSAEIKDGETVVGRGKKISGKLQLWMTKAWAGKELTVDVKAKDDKIAELVLQVNKQRSTLNIKSEGTIKQDVASTAVYEIETDGEKLPTSVVPVVTGDLISIVHASINTSGNLAVTVDPAKFEAVNTVTVTGTGDEVVRTVTPKEAVITITDPESEGTLNAEVTVTANAIFDTASKPSVSLVDGGASDTVLNVNVSMDGVITPKNDPSKVYYVITATAKEDVAASGDTPASKRDDTKLESTVTEIVAKTGSSQRVALQVGKSTTQLGNGAEWAYDVTAKAVYVLNGVKPTGTAETVAADTNTDVSALSDKLETSTVTPLFEAGLKLKKDSKKKPASTLYTGQTNLYIATPQWSKKNVNYKITAAAVDLTGGLNPTINDAGDLVVEKVGNNVSLGKHTIQVTATADMTENHTMYASRATITVTVVKGINTLGVSTPGNQIYKQANKAATYKVTPIYNNNWGGYYTPKTKKVTWKVVGVDSTIGDANYDGTYNGSIDALEETDAPAGITIKNGTVTVAQNFTVDARHPKNNQFRVLVQAADFAGNTTAALSNPVYIKSEALDVTNLVIAKKTTGGYNIITVKEGTKTAKAVDVKAKDIDGASVYATAKTVAPGFVSDAKWNSLGVVDEYNLTYAPAKGNVLTVNSDGEINVLASGKKATITVTTTDGSKKKNSIALNMGYTDVDPTAALQITAFDANNHGKKVEVTKEPTKEADAEAKVEKDYTLPGVTKLSVIVHVGQRDDKSFKFTPANKYHNYKLTVKGGKVDPYGDIYTTAKVTTLNLTVGAGKEAKKYTYVLTNLAYNETVKPKVTVKNTLHQYGSVDEQKVTMVALNGKESFGDNKYAKVELDKTAMPKYGTTQYSAWWTFNYLLKSNYIKLNKDNGEFVLEFNEFNEGDGVSLTPGTYKLKVTVGEGDTASKFVAKTQPVNVSVKVVANKAFTFKPTTSYTINKVDGGAVLTGKTNVNVKAGETATVKFTKLQNANVDGKSNLFTHYFKIEPDEITGTQRLALNTTDPLVQKLLYETKEDGTLDTSKPIADPDLSALSKDTKNLTGYITYSAWSNVNYYWNSEYEKTVKITVKIAPEAKNNKYKASQKYVPEGGTEIGLKKNVETQVNILVNGAYVSVAHAIVDDSKAKSNAPELTATGVNTKGQIVLKAAADLEADKKGGYSINLLIVPASSFYAKAITDTAKAEDKKALIERYGTPVKVTVVAKEKPKATADPSAPKAPGESEDPDDPTPAEKTEDEVKAMVEAWIEKLTGTNTWLKNDTTAATLTEKANADKDILESGWIVTVTAASFTGTSAAAATTAATEGAAITYTLTKGPNGTPTSSITSTATITLPAGAIGMSDVKTVLGDLSIEVAPETVASDVRDAVVTELDTLVNIKNYYGFEVATPSNDMGSDAGTSTLTVTVTITPKADGETADTLDVTVTAASD